VIVERWFGVVFVCLCVVYFLLCYPETEFILNSILMTYYCVYIPAFCVCFVDYGMTKTSALHEPVDRKLLWRSRPLVRCKGISRR
jgi:hypothetical protein